MHLQSKEDLENEHLKVVTIHVLSVGCASNSRHTFTRQKIILSLEFIPLLEEALKPVHDVVPCRDSDLSHPAYLNQPTWAN